MNVLIIGGSGFIGTQLLPVLLQRGHSVAILDLRQSAAYPDLCTLGDVRDLNTVRRATQGMDVVYNLAAEHADNVQPVSLYYDVNVEGSKNVIRAASEHGIRRLVFTSTAAVYGLDKGEVDESMEPEPFNDYGASKLQAEKVFQKWAAKSPERRLVILRPTVIFGENNRGNVYNLFKQVNNGLFAMIGNGSNRKSVGYVKNIAAFLAFVLDLGPGVHLFNFTDKPDLSMKELVEVTRRELGKPGRCVTVPFWFGLVIGYAFDAISYCTGRKFPVSSIRVKKFCEHTILRSDRLLGTGFTAPHSLPEAVKRTIQYEFAGQSDPVA